MTGKKIGQKLISAFPVGDNRNSCFVPVPSSFNFVVSRVSNNDWKLQKVTVGRNNSAVVLTTFKINCMAGSFVWAKKRGRTGCMCCFFVNALPFFKLLSQCSQLPVYNP